jgi:SAM-dependent methyltransferase
MRPVQRDSYFLKRPIRLLSDEIQLIEVYRNLYTPKKINMWEDELRAEKILFSGVKKVEKTIIKGGRVAKRLLVTELFENLHEGVVIGEFACQKLGLNVDPARLQLISSMHPDEMRAWVQDLLKKHAVTVSYVKYPLNIPSDFQTSKFTYYAVAGSDKVPLLDVYDSTIFEMIPYWLIDGVKVGNPWVLLRFLFIDMWLMKLISNFGDAPQTKHVERLLDQIYEVRKFAATRPALDMFQLENYSGVYIDENVAKRKMIKEIGDRFPPYYPCKSEKSGGSEPAAAPACQLTSNYHSEPLDMSSNISQKTSIMQKITGHTHVKSLDQALNDWYRSEEKSAWGVGKSLQRFYQVNKSVLRYVPKTINVYLDLGCGDGLDIVAMNKTFKISNSICADITDNRAQVNKKYNYLQVNPFKPLEIDNNTVDFCTIFHVLHHAEDAEFRLRDLCRVMATGGIVVVKDHDVLNELDASNVDFEHIVYDVGSAKYSYEDCITKYHELEHMRYFSASSVCKYMCAMGFERIYHQPPGISNLTKTYRSVFKKIEMQCC